ncbi:hypothetical protein BDA99DRAFT_577012 [Phascolomyces articulosus]|uniref:Uncharacterized protein n=1 Tax=Phascolomyces articulosus TaxID=60185 RepID=A0AAD5P7D4_9FUNG|nr:hypothetical protein BDA99DRAFT_577012 [Phascolomyces articulosus]
MGYQTDFEGAIKITPTLPTEVIDTINSLAEYRNNTDGDGDASSFDGTIHHLQGESDTHNKEDHMNNDSFLPLSKISLRLGRVSQVPSFWCDWHLVNRQKQQDEFNKRKEEETVLVWNNAEKFYEYMYWLQYMIDFVTLYAIEQHGIQIERFDGSITWKGEEREGDDDNGDYSTSVDRGTLSIYRRETPELTRFYPQDFLPIPAPPAIDERERIMFSKNDEGYYLKKPSTPKGKPAMSTFGVKAQVYPKQPLELSYLNQIANEGSISRGDYLLYAQRSPNHPDFSSSSDDNNNPDENKNDPPTTPLSLDLYLHHEKAALVYHPSDPVFDLAYFTKSDAVWEMDEKELGKWRVARALATSIQAEQVKSLKNISADMLLEQSKKMEKVQDRHDHEESNNDDEQYMLHVEELMSPVGYRQCTGCGGRMEGPAYIVAIWDWPKGYAGAYVYTIYCSVQCFNKFDTTSFFSST